MSEHLHHSCSLLERGAQLVRPHLAVAPGFREFRRAYLGGLDRVLGQ